MFRRNRIVGPETGSSLCQVWMVDLHALRPGHDRLLNPVERARRQAYRFDDDRQRFTLGVVMMRLVAGQALGLSPERVDIDRRCRRCGEPHGKPQLVVAGRRGQLFGALRRGQPFDATRRGQPFGATRQASGLHTSVSHAGTVVAVALTAAGPVGIDVERREGRLLEPRDVALAAGEHPETAAAFSTLWCRKEAVVKATADGLRVPLTEVVVSAHDEPARLLSYRGAFVPAMLADVPAPEGFAAAVAVLTAKPVEVQVVSDARRLLDEYLHTRA